MMKKFVGSWCVIIALICFPKVIIASHSGGSTYAKKALDSSLASVDECKCDFPFEYEGQVYNECFYNDERGDGEFVPVCCHVGRKCKQSSHLRNCANSCPQPMPPSVESNSSWTTMTAQECKDSPWQINVNVSSKSSNSARYLTCESMDIYCRSKYKVDGNLNPNWEDYVEWLHHIKNSKDMIDSNNGKSHLDACCACGGGTSFERTVRTIPCSTEETGIIKELYSITGGEKFWINTKGHHEASLDPCSESWFGIQCKYDYENEIGHVVEINLDNNGLGFPGKEELSTFREKLEDKLPSLQYYSFGYFRSILTFPDQEGKSSWMDGWPKGNPCYGTEKEFLVQLFVLTGGKEEWKNSTGWEHHAYSDPCIDKWFGCECDKYGFVVSLDLGDNNLGYPYQSGDSFWSLFRSLIVDFMNLRYFDFGFVKASASNSAARHDVEWPNGAPSQESEKKVLVKLFLLTGGAEEWSNSSGWENYETSDPCMDKWYGSKCDKRYGTIGDLDGLKSNNLKYPGASKREEFLGLIDLLCPPGNSKGTFGYLLKFDFGFVKGERDRTSIPMSVTWPKGLPSHKDEKDTLLQLFHETGGDKTWNAYNGWNDPSSDPCFDEWYGVVCSDRGRLLSLEKLEDNNLIYPGPSFLSLLDSIQNFPKLDGFNFGFVKGEKKGKTWTLDWPSGKAAKDDEKQILLKIFLISGGTDAWSQYDGWDDPDSDPCLHYWYGVTCDPSTGSIHKLSLGFNHLANLLEPAIQSIFESSIDDLTELQELDISGNRGVLEVQSDNTIVWGIPKVKTTQREALETLKDHVRGSTASWKNETDPCQDYWSGIVCDTEGNVVSLRLSSGSLQGNLPTTGLFGKLPVLAQVDFSNNVGLKGYIPSDFNLNHLKILNLGNTGIEGGIPNTWESANGVAVGEIDISNAKLSFVASDIVQMSNFKQLKVLNLSGNSLHGDLMFVKSTDTKIGFDALTKLDLSGNYITSIKLSNPKLHRFSVLHELNLENNKLKKLPSGDKYKMLKTLFEFNIKGNSGLNGKQIPSGIKYMENLKVLDVSYCGFKGGFPSSWKSLLEPDSTLDQAKTYGGQIFYADETREIPNPILKHLEVIRASNNYLDGNVGLSVFRPLSSLQSLTSLDISVNNLTGTLGTKDVVMFDYAWKRYDAFKSLKELFMSKNNIKSLGPIFSNDALKELSRLDVSSNDLSGEIPDRLGTQLSAALFHGNPRLYMNTSNMKSSPSFLQVNTMGAWEVYQHRNFSCLSLLKVGWKLDPWYDNYDRCRCKSGFKEEKGGLCSLCDADSYMDLEYSNREKDQSSCFACPLNSGTNGKLGSNSKDDCICSEGYERASSLHCRACPQGKYKSINEVECKVCPNGKYQSEEGQGYCNDCKVGHYCRSGIIEECPAGAYGAAANLESSVCSGNCDWRDFKQSNRSATECSCMDTFVLDTNTSRCLCDKEFYESNQKCVACPEGKFKSVMGNEEALCQYPPVSRKETDSTGFLLGLFFLFLFVCFLTLLWLTRGKKGVLDQFLLKVLTSFAVSAGRVMLEIGDIGSDTVVWYDILQNSSSFLVPYSMCMCIAWVVSIWSLRFRIKQLRLSWNTLDNLDKSRLMKTAPSISDSSAVPSKADDLIEKEVQEVLKDQALTNEQLASLANDIEDTKVSLVLLVFEDIPILFLNILIILSLKRFDELLLFSTMLNAILCGAKCPKLWNLKELIRRKSELEKTLGRRKSLIHLHDKRKSITANPGASENTNKAQK